MPKALELPEIEFITTPEVEDLERVGKAFDLQVANPLAGGVSPILRPEEYFRLGFKILPYGIDLILRVTRAMQVALRTCARGNSR